MFFSVISLLTVSAFGASFDCNHIDMGFHVVHPVGQCVVGKSTPNAEMSMEHLCIDEYTVESRLYEGTTDCHGNNYQVMNTFNCDSNSTFVACDCSHSKDTQCSLVQDIQYAQKADGECDLEQVIEHRTYIVDPTEIPKSFIDNNCFQRKSDNKNGEGSASQTVPVWFHKLSSLYS
mmetsp:Transcript_55447/g.88426  ORF Transcript_55447/g.88426 Transcript_55447/m.88426 type:complete len:176 (+) Transcript_55447:15-542(+)